MGSSGSKKPIIIGGSLLLALSVSACGGGGGVNSVPPPALAPPVTPPPPPPPSPPPPPPPAPNTFATTEFNRSDGPGFHGAITAYQAGATGSGVTVGVIDTGIDPNSHEFTGRIDPRSGDVTTAGRALGDDDGHGSQVSRILAGARDNRDTHGIAFNATILALKADQAGSCTTPVGNTNEANCAFFDSSIAAGINRAVDSGARVINISLGGPGGASSALSAAINRATSQGIVIVVAAGNEGNDNAPAFNPDNPSPFAQALVANGNGLVIIAASVDDQGVFSDFSNRAGINSNTVLSALGEGVCCEYRNDEIFRFMENGQTFVRVFNGTSFAAPQIAGGAALLAQAFPNLTGQQIVSLLLSSARDAGAAGTDAIYGRGILDIARAFAPVGTTSLAGTTTIVPLSGNAGTTSGPMGDVALSNRPVNAVILDSFGRAYDVDLSHGLNASAPRLRLTPALTSQSHAINTRIGPAELAFSIRGNSAGGAQLTALTLSGQEQAQARILAARISATIATDTRFSLGIRQAAAGHVAALQEMQGRTFLTATDARLESGFDQIPATSLALRQQIGKLGITGSIETGQSRLYERATIDAVRSGTNRYPYSTIGISLDRRFGSAKLALGATWTNEDETILGARFAQFIGQNGSRSLFVNGNGEFELGKDWKLGASWRQGWTYADGNAGLLGDSLLKSSAFSFDINRNDIFQSGDSLSFRIAQPLRVTSGGLSLNLPIAYDYTTQTPTFGRRVFTLAPSGREIASEIAWGMPIGRGYLSSNLFWRQQPGHFSDASDDFGAAFMLSYGF